jgi:hypothetical protein
MRRNDELALRVQFLLDQLEGRLEAECARGKRRRRRLRRMTFGLLPHSGPSCSDAAEARES